MAQRRHALHRLSLRRPDDRRRRQSAHARVQLPAGRSGSAAHPDAPEVRPAAVARGGARRRAGRMPTRSGTGARRSAWCSPRAATPSSPCQGDRIDGLPAPSEDVPRVPRRHAPRRRPGWSPAAAACCASPHSAIRCAWRVSAPMQSPKASASRACSTGATSATAACGGPEGDARAPRSRGGRTLPGRPAGAHRRGTRSARRRALPDRPLDARRGRRRRDAGHRGGPPVRARRRELLARQRRATAAVGERLAARSSPAAASTRWAFRWCCIRAIPTARRCT